MMFCGLGVEFFKKALGLGANDSGEKARTEARTVEVELLAKTRQAASQSKRNSAPNQARPAKALSPEAIAERAHIIWEREGRPQGKDLEHWLLAEKELLAD